MQRNYSSVHGSFPNARQSRALPPRQGVFRVLPQYIAPLSGLSAAVFANLVHSTLLLSPGAGLGPFRLGAPLPDVLALIRSPQHRSTFRCVEIKWDAQDAQGQPGGVALSLPEHGTHLLFDGVQQRLRLVEVHDVTRLQVRCGGHVFGGAAHAPTFGRVSEALGPTYPGEPAGSWYPLQYPGVTFLFPLGPTALSAAAQESQQQQEGHPRERHRLSCAVGALPLPLSTPAARIIVHHGAAASLAAARAAPPPPLPRGAPYMEPVEAVPCQGLLLGAAGVVLRFGDSPQDVVSELGPPTSAHSKPARLGAAGLVGPAADYFFSYASRGVDLLFCGATHRLTKAVLHANQPGHPDFGVYSRCNFRVHGGGRWSLPGTGGGGGAAVEEAADSPPAAYTSAGSEGAGSMRTAASEASLDVIEGGCAAHRGGLAAAVAAAGVAQAACGGSAGTQQGTSALQADAEQPQRQESGLSAAYNSLVRFIDGALHIDGEPSSGGSSGHEAAQPAVQGSAAEPEAAADGAGAGESGGCGGAAAAAAALGRPPRPPTSAPIHAPPPPVVSAKSSKKKKKRERQRAAAAAKLLAASGGGGDESGGEGTDTDASFADSAPSSLASSPGMTSFLTNIAATGGALGTGRPHQFPAGNGCTAGAAGMPGALPSGYSSEASSADFAGKERRMENGSAFDGWSEGDDLALLVDSDAAHAVSSAEQPPQQPSMQHGTVPQPAAPQRPLRVSTAVQTAPAAIEGADAALMPGQLLGTAAAGHADPDSPESYVMADSPALFDESAAGAEYESVPCQRSSGTQTQPHLLSGPPLRASSAAPHRPGSQLRFGSGGGGAPPAGSAGVVGVCSTLADVQAAFGSGSKPALHTRLGGRHPFGPTHLFAYRGVVFEVLHNGCIATVTLFEA